MGAATFSGKVVLVTGGASGIGGAAVEEFSATGAVVVVADLADGRDVVEASGPAAGRPSSCAPT